MNEEGRTMMKGPTDMLSTPLGHLVHGSRVDPLHRELPLEAVLPTTQAGVEGVEEARVAQVLHRHLHRHPVRAAVGDHLLLLVVPAGDGSHLCWW